MAFNNAVTVKLDPETSATMQSVADKLVEVEKLLGQIGELLSANLREGLKAEITPAQDPPGSEIDRLTERVIAQLKQQQQAGGRPTF